MTTASNRDALANASDLRFRYSGRRGEPQQTPFELNVPSLFIDRSESTVIFGPSGSGKSTLLKLLGGILAPSSGDLVVCGQPLHRSSDRERRRYRLNTVGFVFQDYPLIASLNAEENVLLPLRLGATETVNADTRRRACSLLEQLGLPNRAQDKPHQLSQGERQRVAIARSLITRPKLLLADEPTAGLDPIRAAEAIDLLIGLRASRDITLVAVSHDTNLQQRFNRTLDMQQLTKAPGQPAWF